MAARDIPWLDKRNGVYNVFWYEPPSPAALERDPRAKGRTERFGLRTRDPVEAQTKYAAFLVHGKDLVARVDRFAGLTLAQALDDYYKEHVTALDDRGRPKVSDPVRAEQAISHMKAWFGEKKLLKSIDIPACRGYAEARRDGLVGGGKYHQGERKKGSDSTIRRELVVLRAASNHARKWKRISLQDMPTFELPPDSEAGQEAPWFTKDEIAVLLKAQSDAIALAEIADGNVADEQKFHDWITLVYWWGSRKTAVTRLQVNQVSLATGVVNLQKAGERATKKRRPKVPIYDHLRPVLERLVAAAEHGWLFGATVDYYKRFVALCDACGVPERGPHALRHSRITHMLMDGENPYKVAKLVGDSLLTILKVYGHHSPEFLKGEQ